MGGIEDWASALTLLPPVVCMPGGDNMSRLG